MLRSRSEAEDVVQEAFLIAWRRRETCRSPAAPLPWLLQITRNEALSQLRRRRDEGFEEAHDPGMEDPGLVEAPDRLDVGRVLSSLSREDRRLLELRYHADLTQPRVAATLGIPEGTVKVRLHRLRSQLRVALEGQL